MDALQLLRDREAICDAQARYCRLFDAKDWDGVAGLLTEDYATEVVGTAHDERVEGRDTVIAHIRYWVGDATTVHHVHSPEISIDGDEARAVWAMQERIAWDEPGRKLLFTGYGHYHQRWIRIDGAWKLAELILARLLSDTVPPGVTAFDLIP